MKIGLSVFFFPVLALLLSSWTARAANAGSGIDFGEVSVGSEVTRQTSLMYQGSETVVPNFLIVGRDADQFSIVHNGCQVFVPYSPCTITLSFQPTFEGPANALLQVITGQGHVTNAAISGVGIARPSN